MRIQELLEGADNTPDLVSIFRDFLPFAVEELDLKSVPKIKLHLHLGSVDDQPSFGSFNSDTKEINIAIEDRHPLDILRTLAHEMVHYKQNEETGLRPGAGATGSPEENQAHELAGIVMRNFNKAHPELFKIDAVNLEEAKKKRKKKFQGAAYGPGPYGWYGFDAGYSGDGGGSVGENFADGRNPQDKGDSKRHGINTKASVSSLRKTAKQGGRKGQLAHWLANMKAGRAKAKRK
jgi:hypothetical protein